MRTRPPHRLPLLKPLLALLVLVLLLPLGGLWAAPGALAAEPERPAAPTVLAQRLLSWPDWRLPAPLPRPGRSDLVYPEWFAGTWRAQLHDPEGRDPDLTVTLRFRADGPGGAVVGERAFNAAAIGRAVLGDSLLNVRDDPSNPNRQIAALAQDQRLESTVVGRREEQPDADTLLADELTLQVLHGSGDPRVSRIETLSRYRRVAPGRIEGEQWQANYGSPGDGLLATPLRSWRGRLLLERLEQAEQPERLS